MKRVEGRLDRGEEERGGASVAEVLRIENSWDCCERREDYFVSFLSFVSSSSFFFSVCLQRMKGWTKLKYEKRFSE